MNLPHFFNTHIVETVKLTGGPWGPCNKRKEKRGGGGKENNKYPSTVILKVHLNIYIYICMYT